MEFSGFYIDFYLSDSATLSRLQKLLQYVSKQKLIGCGGQIEDLEYLIFEQKNLFFSEQEWQRFWWPTKEELKRFWDTWKSLSKTARQQHLSSVPWDFETLFDAIGQGEYLIQNCVPLNKGQYRLYYLPFAAPFGGTEPLKALLQIYGAAILFDFWLESES